MVSLLCSSGGLPVACLDDSALCCCLVEQSCHFIPRITQWPLFGEVGSVLGIVAAGGADPVLPVQSLQQCPAVGVRQVASVLDVPVFARGDDA